MSPATDEAAQLAVKLLQLGDGYDAATVIAALGRAAAGAVTFAVADPSRRGEARDLFINQFRARCAEYDDMLTAARSAQ